MTGRNTKTVASKSHHDSTLARKAPEEEKTGTDVVIEQRRVPGQIDLGELSSIENEIEEYAGAGTSQKAEDNVLPFILKLQSNSPACNPRGEEHVDGALPGHILLKNSPNPIVDGEVGIVVQPCWFHKAIVEWVPRNDGGGAGQPPVTHHEEMPPDAEEYTVETGSRRWRRKSNGNDLVETRYHGVLIDGVPYIIAMSSTDNSVSKNWMQLMNQFKLRSGKVAPSWLRRYRLTTKLRKNQAGEWFVWAVQDVGPIEHRDEFDAGANLNKMLTTGEKVVGELDENEFNTRPADGSGSGDQSDQDETIPF